MLTAEQIHTLTAEQIYAIAEHHGLKVVNRWEPCSLGRELPALKRINVWFNKEPAPEAWQLLMSNATSVPMEVNGVRPQDFDTLHPAYAALLPQVNAARAQIGLGPVIG